MDIIRINGHHLGMVAGYIYGIYGNPALEREHLSFFGRKADEARALYERIIGGSQILVVAGKDDLCGQCDPEKQWACTDEDGNYELSDIDAESARRNGFEVDRQYSLDHVLEKYKFLEKKE